MFKILLEDLRTEEEPAQEQAYQYELKSRKPGVDTEARWVRKGRHYRYGYKKHVLTEGLSERIHRISWKLWHKSEAYAWASCAPEQQIALCPPLGRITLPRGGQGGDTGISLLSLKIPIFGARRWKL